MQSIRLVKSDHNYRLFTTVRICVTSDRIVVRLKRKSRFKTCRYAVRQSEQPDVAQYLLVLTVLRLMLASTGSANISRFTS